MRNYPFRIALIYFIMATLWIFLSDRVAETFTPPQYLTQVQSIKGFVFVLLSSAVLFFLSKKYYRLVKKSELEYRKLFQDNPHPMYVLDTTSLRFLTVNNAALARYKYRQEEFMNMHVTDIRPASEHQAILDHLKKIEGDAFTESGIWQHMDKYGEPFYVRVYSHGTIFEGKKARVVLAIDIDETIQAERKMQLSESKLNGLINNTDDLIWMIDKEGKVAAINEPFKLKFKQATGVDLNINKKIDVTQLPATWFITHWGDHMKEAFAGNKMRIEQEIETNGKKEYFEIILNPIFSISGEVFNVGCFARDITQRKEAENRIKEQVKKLKAVAWIQSHEVRRPLANIIGLVNLLKAGEDPQKDEHLLNHLLVSANELDEVVKKLVETSATQNDLSTKA